MQGTFSTRTSHRTRQGSIRVPLLMFITILGIMWAQFVTMANEWPERVATHFNWLGEPNGWMDRTSHLWFWAIFSTLMPLGMLGVFFAVRFLPASCVNIPDRDYWLAPERRLATIHVMFVKGLWFASWMAAFFVALHHLLLKANQSEPIQLNNRAFFSFLGLFLLGVAVWVAGLRQRFRVKH